MSELKEKDRFSLFGEMVVVRRVGEQQSEIKWPNGKETIVPNSWLTERL